MTRTYSIGWDVGAWASKYGDALWILNGEGKTQGKPAHGNLGDDIKKAQTAKAFIQFLFIRCKTELPPDTGVVTLAIDSPLAFPVGFVKLLTGKCHLPEPLGKAINNPYLFRGIEAFAAKIRKRNPLSPLQDQIGSQATKIAHVLSKFKLRNNRAGVWLARRDGGMAIRVIEAYPAMSKKTRGRLLPDCLQQLYETELKKVYRTNQDERDALICASVAYLFTQRPSVLYQPLDKGFVPEEGWIWFPKTKASAPRAIKSDP